MPGPFKAYVLKTIQTLNQGKGDIAVSLISKGCSQKCPSVKTNYTVELLYSTCHTPIGINKSTLKVLLEMVSKVVIMLTHRGQFKQVDGVAIGSSVGPLLGNIFSSTHDSN